MTATPTSADLGAANGDDFHAGLAEQGIRMSVAVISEDHTRLKRDNIVAVLPLLALGFIGISACTDRTKLVEAQRIADHFEHRLLLRPRLDAAIVLGRIEAVAADLAYHFLEQGHEIPVTEA